MKRRCPLRPWRLWPLLGLLLPGGGCLTEYRDQMARQAADIEGLQSDVARIRERLDAIELSQQALHRDFGELGHAQQAVTQTVDQRFSQVDDRLQAIDRKRVEDRKLVVDQLSGKISTIMSSAPRRGRSGSQYGFEHVVKPGETLSEIAAAYKVTVKAVMDANDISNANLIRAGDTLFIPE